MIQSKPRTLVVGSTGFLGATLVSQLESATGIDRSLVDLSHPISPAALDAMRAGDYRFVIICAGITDVEKCFRDRELSDRVNISGTIGLLNAIRQIGATPIFFSSDYVFAPRPGPHPEDAPRAPETQYGKQKLAVEKYLEENFDRYLIFRTSKLLSKSAHPKNILWQVLSDLQESKPIRAFEDQWLNPVFIEDIASVVDAACKQELNGAYHLGTRRIFTRAELAMLIAKASGHDLALVRPARMAEMRFPETRPHHNTLDCSKIENALGVRFTEVEEEIKDKK
ncbi:MAG: SDR family oxidoreductase [Bdellovibrionia bacterium]